MATKRKGKMIKKREEEIPVFMGSGNVYEDLGFPEPEEALAKAELVRQISHLITRRKLSQLEVAEILGLPQPKVSLLLRGRISGFSTDRLLRFLNALHCDVEIRIHRPKARSRRRGRIAVTLS
jgi:predicted XRE-type DNA-binding protein